MDRAARCRSGAPGHVGVQGEPIPDKKEAASRSIVASTQQRTRMKAEDRGLATRQWRREILPTGPARQRHEAFATPNEERNVSQAHPPGHSQYNEA
jgi:hypothetical protein